MGLGDTYYDGARSIWGYLKGDPSIDESPRDWAMLALLESMRAQDDWWNEPRITALMTDDPTAYDAAVAQFAEQAPPEKRADILAKYLDPETRAYWQAIGLVLRTIDTTLVPLLPKLQPIFDSVRKSRDT